MGLAVDELYADEAVLIPELVESLPFRFFATSSIDALIHSIESYTSPKANPFTQMFSKKAMKMILETYKAIAKDGEEARKPRIGQVLLASIYAGILECKPEEVYEEIEVLLNHLIPKKALHEYGVKEEELEEFTEVVMTKQGRLMANNYVKLDRDTIYGIYKTLF